MQLLGTGYQRAAKTSRIVITGSSPLCFASWNVSFSGPDLPTTNFESYSVVYGDSYGERLHGPIEAALRFGGDWDAHLAPLGSPPGLYVRDDLAGLFFYPSRIDGVFWNFPYAAIRTANNGVADINGKVTFDCDGFSQGIFNQPTESV